MDHNGPGEGRVDCLHLLEELEHADGGEGHSEVRPAGEVELGDLPGSFGGITGLLHRHGNTKTGTGIDRDRHTDKKLVLKRYSCRRQSTDRH